MFAITHSTQVMKIIGTFLRKTTLERKRKKAKSANELAFGTTTQPPLKLPCPRGSGTTITETISPA